MSYFKVTFIGLIALIILPFLILLSLPLLPFVAAYGLGKIIIDLYQLNKKPKDTRRATY